MSVLRESAGLIGGFHLENKIIVLLSTYNGEKYLREQLDSIFSQTHKNLIVFARDDGSKDSTCSILEEYSTQYPLVWSSGANLGFALSFMKLVSDSMDADYYAFCDQDDIWHKDKLEAAISKMAGLDQEQPVLYASNQTYVDSDGKNAKERFDENPSINFEERFFRGYLSGCTMVFNKSLRDLINKNRPSDEFIKARWHDTWTLLVCLALGKVVYDPISHIDYRRHGSNTSVAQTSKLSRYVEGLKKIIRDKSRKNLRSWTAKTILEIFGNEIDEEKNLFLKRVSEYRNSWITRIKLAFDSDIKLTKPESRLEFMLKVFWGVL